MRKMFPFDDVIMLRKLSYIKSQLIEAKWHEYRNEIGIIIWSINGI